MKIQITKILSNLPQQPLVEFQSAYGIGRAIWADVIPPQLFEDYYVEYTIPETLVWGETIIANDEGIMAIRHQDNTLFLYGELENLDEVTFDSVRIGESIIFITIEASKEYNPAPHFVKIVSQQAVLYDTHF